MALVKCVRCRNLYGPDAYFAHEPCPGTTLAPSAPAWLSVPDGVHSYHAAHPAGPVLALTRRGLMALAGLEGRN